MRTATPAPAARGNEAELYRTYAHRLERYIAGRVNTGPDTIADA